MRKAVAEADDKPDLESVEITAKLEAPEPADAVFDSSDDFVTATLKLKAIKALNRDDSDDAEGGAA